MAEADKVEDDEDLRKKLWLMVAKHVIEQEKGAKRENIRKAIAFLKETDGLLKIEDILPFFPDFALIDDFKVRIYHVQFCSSFSDHNNSISTLGYNSSFEKLTTPFFFSCSCFIIYLNLYSLIILKFHVSYIQLFFVQSNSISNNSLLLKYRLNTIHLPLEESFQLYP